MPKVYDETNAETRTLSRKRHKMNTWQDYISDEIDVSKELHADFNFLKINLMSHWVKKICWYGVLQQDSAVRHEQVHKTNPKDGWNASNHNLNYLPQVITFYRPILCFQIRELNLQALAQHWENRAAACKLHPCGADLAAPLSPHSYAKLEFMGPQNCRDRKHLDARINNFNALVDNRQDATHRVAIYSGLWKWIKHKSHNETYISDEQLHPMELCIHHGNNIQIEGLDGEPISQMCRCTGSQSWRQGDWRNDWVWVKQCPGTYYNALHRCLPWQLQRLFTINLLNKDRLFVEYWLALALITIAEYSGNLDRVSKFVQVRTAPAAIALQVFSVTNIVGCGHVIPVIATSSEAADGRNKRWIVNNHIDLATWNYVYN